MIDDDTYEVMENILYEMLVSDPLKVRAEVMSDELPVLSFLQVSAFIYFQMLLYWWSLLRSLICGRTYSCRKE